MKENMNIAQLRGTIFAPLNIGYTPDNYNKFREMLLPGAKAYNATAPEMIAPGINPNLPQYGFPWRLFNRNETEGDYNIVFLPGKIDIILTKDVAYGGDTESIFCNKCIDCFSKILGSQVNDQRITVNRIAYAPLYAIKIIDLKTTPFWNSYLKKTVIDGMPIQDVSYNFLLKREMQFDDKLLQMNFMHNIYDGIKIKSTEKGEETQNVVLIQLDMNSIPEIPLALDSEGVKKFFSVILNEKEKLIEYVCE